MTYTTIRDSDGVGHIVNNVVRDSDGNPYSVSNVVRDSDGNPYTIFTAGVTVVRTVRFIAIPNRRFVA